jgi:hypothetical protein
VHFSQSPSRLKFSEVTRKDPLILIVPFIRFFPSMFSHPNQTATKKQNDEDKLWLTVFYFWPCPELQPDQEKYLLLLKKIDVASFEVIAVNHKSKCGLSSEYKVYADNEGICLFSIALCGGLSRYLWIIKRNSDREMELEYKQMHRIVYKKILKNKFKRYLSI